MIHDVALWRRVVRMLGWVLFARLMLPSLIRIVVWRSHWQPALDALRWFNKKTTNPQMLKRAGKRVTTIHHKGRGSGKEYVTPVWAARVGRSFFVQLPYGTHVDWCRNVLAGGGCALEHEGGRYDTVAPVIVPAAEAAPLLPPMVRRMHRMFGVESYLRLDINTAENPAEKTG